MDYCQGTALRYIHMWHMTGFEIFKCLLYNKALYNCCVGSLVANHSLLYDNDRLGREQWLNTAHLKAGCQDAMQCIRS